MSRMLLSALVVLVSALAWCPRASANSASIHDVEVISTKSFGEHPSPGGSFSVSGTIHEMGGFLVLSVTPASSQSLLHKAEDVTGFAWLSDHLLIYSTSPIYGKPGIFIFDCLNAKSKRIVGPHNITPAYPDGTDDFELVRIALEEERVYFYYTRDVDATDFRTFRTDENLYSVDLDGKDFRKVERVE